MLLTACHNNSTQSENKVLQPEQKILQSENESLNKNWRLNINLSTLSFVTTKNKTISEQHSLMFKRGSLHEKRKFKARVNLNSIDTLIPIRDQRLREILFETETYPEAIITTIIPRELNLEANQNANLSFTLDLHGMQKLFTTEVVIQTVNDKLVVTNYNPILVNAKDFGLDNAVNTLTKVAGLQSIDYEVSVDFKLTFEKLLN